MVKNMAKNQPPVLAWAKVPGKTYQSLLSPDWASLGPPPVTSTTKTSALTVPFTPKDQRRFYRLKVLP